MKLLVKVLGCGALLAMLIAECQDPPFPRTIPKEESDHKLPNGKSQNEEILKADYEKSLKDAAALVELSLALQQELIDETHHVLSVSSLKKTEEIEKLAKRLRGRMRRF